MRIDTSSEPTLITIFGHNVHKEEVNIFEEVPLTVIGETLHIGTTSFFLSNSEAAKQNRNEIIGN